MKGREKGVGNPDILPSLKNKGLKRCHSVWGIEVPSGTGS